MGINFFKKRAGDRHYWDGWSDKAMFIKPDGTFTQGNVYINQDEEACIVVLVSLYIYI